MKKLSLLILSVFALGQSFVMAKIMPVKDRICSSRGGVFNYKTQKCMSGGIEIEINKYELEETEYKDRINREIRIRKDSNKELECEKRGFSRIQLNSQRSDCSSNIGEIGLSDQQILELRKIAQNNCKDMGGSFVNNKCDFSNQSTGITNSGGKDGSVQATEFEQILTIATSGDDSASGIIITDSGSSPETTGKVVTSEAQNNKTTIISILVVLIGIGLVIIAFRLRKLNQKNENPLPPQQ